MTLAPGTTVGRYQILEPLGQGGMATVYKAFQPSLQREVALKVLRPGYAQDQEFRERFEREAIAIARLRHPHIVQVFDFEVAPSGEYVLAMEFLEGGTLKERLARLAAEGRGLDPAQSVRILGEVAQALSYAHEKGVIHRDVKPSNVMLTQKDWAVVTDFGIARILGATSHTQTGVGIGTPEYMAPEQGQGSAIDHRADIYSLGAMAYELLTGRVPYSADTPLAVVLAHIKDPLPLPSKVNPTIGKGVERALLRALAKDPQARFESATAFAEALSAGLAEDTKGRTMPTVVVRGAAPVTAAPVRPAPAALRQVTLAIPPVLAQRPMVVGVAGALVLAIVVGGVVAGNALQRSAPTSSAPSIEPAQSAAAAPTAGSTASNATGPAATAAASPGSAPKFAIPPKGTLLWEAKLDGSGVDFGRPNPQRNGASIAAGVGFMDFITPREGAGIDAEFNSPSRTTYIVEVDVSATFPAEADLVSGLILRRCQGNGGFLALDLRPGREGIQLDDYNAVAQSHDSLTALLDLGDLKRPTTIAAVVEASQVSVFVDQKQVARVPYSRCAASGRLAFRSSLYSAGPATTRVHGARLYELPAVGATTAATPTAPPTPVAPISVSPATAAPAPQAPTPKFAVPAKGALIADMPMTASLFRNTNQGLSPNRVDVRFTSGVAEFTAAQPNSALNGDINRVLPQPDRYIVELDLAAGPAADMSISYVIRQWAFQSDQQKAYGSFALAVSAETFSGGIQLYSAPADRVDTVGGTIAGVADMTKGFILAVVVEHPSYTVFLDQKQIARFTVTGELGTSRPTLAVRGQGGSLKLLGLRFYELPK